MAIAYRMPELCAAVTLGQLDYLACEALSQTIERISKNTHFSGEDIIITVVSVCDISSLMPVIRNPLEYFNRNFNESKKYKKKDNIP